MRKTLKWIGISIGFLFAAALIVDLRTPESVKAERRAKYEAERAAARQAEEAAEAIASAKAEQEDRKRRADRAEEERKEAEEKRQFLRQKHPEQQMKIVKWSWESSGFGSIMVANFTIKNENEVPVKDIVIKCQTSAPSGTELSTLRHTIYERIDSRVSRTFRDVNLGFMHSQSTRASCAVTSAIRLEL